MKVRFLGTGTSYGIPQIGCGCAVCRSADPRDQRLRSSVLVELERGRRVLVDASPDLRAQFLAARVADLDLVVITHVHADHVFGIDDLRAVTNRRTEALPVVATADVLAALLEAFAYAFRGDGGRRVPGLPFLRSAPVVDEVGAEVAGIPLLLFPVPHGSGRSRGVRMGKFAYVTDCHDVPPSARARLRGLDVLVLDALGLNPHPTHLHLERSLELAREIGAERTYFIHMGHEISHAGIEASLPAGVSLAYDGLEIDVG